MSGQKRVVQRLTLPTTTNPDEWAYLDVPLPLTEAEWRQMLAVMEAMKPGLVWESEPEPEPDLPVYDSDGSLDKAASLSLDYGAPGRESD